MLERGVVELRESDQGQVSSETVRRWLPRAQRGTPFHSERLRPIESERVRAHPFGELARQDSHADQV